eukprot:scaffold12871_cov43-Cyclotella_meneghiniana.AAC.2
MGRTVNKRVERGLHNGGLWRVGIGGASVGFVWGVGDGGRPFFASRQKKVWRGCRKGLTYHGA